MHRSAPAKDSYLNMPAILSAAAVTGADAIHPGYGFLSENAGFAEMVEAHGLTFIGPSPAHIRMMGDKIAAKTAMAALGVPLVPGSDGAVPDLRKRAMWPAGSAIRCDQGGRRRRRARHEGGAGSAGAGGGVRASRGPKHARLSATTPCIWRNISIVLAISSCRSWRTIMATWCISVSAIAACSGAIRSCWRRPARRRSSAAARDKLGATATAALRKLGYRNAGTLEFLYQDGQFAFIEMNTRLQVEHPVTEMVCGIDLVREQIRIAAGAELSVFAQTAHRISCNGYSGRKRIDGSVLS